MQGWAEVDNQHVMRMGQTLARLIILYYYNWVIVKLYNSGIARWEGCIGHDIWERKCSFPAPSGALGTPHFHVFISLRALWTPSFEVFMEASVSSHNWLNQWPLKIVLTSRNSPLLGGKGWDWKFSPLNTWFGLLATSFHPLVTWGHWLHEVK